MSRAGGLLLIGAGIAVASLTVRSGPDNPIVVSAERTDIAKSTPAEVPPVPAVPTARRTVEDAEAQSLSPVMVAPGPKPAVGPAQRADAAAPQTAPTAVVVTLAKPQSEPSSARRWEAEVIPDRASLSQELQRELRRVGCYDGQINGSWTPATRKAMKAFTDRVNATLPVEKPDYILLTLVKGQQDTVCGKSCPAGQGMSDDGRCLPNAILAQAARRPVTPTVADVRHSGSSAEQPKPTISGWSASVTTSTTTLPAPPEGRMALAGPQIEPSALRSTDRRDRVPPAGIYERRAPQYAQRKPSRRVNVGAMYRQLEGVR